MVCRGSAHFPWSVGFQCWLWFFLLCADKEGYFEESFPEKDDGDPGPKTLRDSGLWQTCAWFSSLGFPLYAAIAF